MEEAYDIRKLAPTNTGLTEEILGKLFEKMWPDLENDIANAPSEDTPARRDTAEMVEETLGVVRNLDRNLQMLLQSQPPSVLVPVGGNSLLAGAAEGSAFAKKLKLALGKPAPQDEDTPPERG
jgi:hypothetical protein